MAKIYMQGIDISNHQSAMDLDKVLTNRPDCKVVICKVSEGTSFTDAYANGFIDIALKHKCLVGVYHFARADKNGWKAEADFFLSLSLKYKGKVFYVLDWEVKASASNASWAKNWLDYVASTTGSVPWFYSYESMINANNYSSLVKYPLWVARYRDYNDDVNFDMAYSGTAPNVKWWSSYVAWQWTSSGKLDGYSGRLDCNAFYASAEQIKKYIGGSTATDATVKYTFATTDPVKISNSGCDENGNYRNGVAGDNNGKEWRIRDWYSRPWNCVLRHPDANVRSYIAHLAVQSAENDKIGYDQNQRNTFWTQLQKVGYDPSKITVACESDCSAGVIAITKAVGHLLGIDKLKNIGATYTGNMRSAYLSAGFMVLTADKYTDQDDYLLAGDILLNDAHHVATAVTNGRYGSSDGTVNTDEEYDMPLLKKGSKGTAVKVLQVILGGLTVDGDFGWKTLNSVINFQKKAFPNDKSEWDGEVGAKTWKKLLDTL